MNQPEDRTLVIKLPDTVPLGPHEVVVIVGEETTDRTSADSNAAELMRFAGTIQSFSGIDGLEYQRHIRAEAILKKAKTGSQILE